MEQIHIEIKPMCLEHIAQISLLEQQCFSMPWSEQSLMDELENPFAVYFVAVVMGSGAVAGYAGMHHILDEGHITNVAVDTKLRRHGIATALMDELVVYGEDNNLTLLTLEVRRSNSAALSLYSQMGFQELGFRKDYYVRPVEDALILNYSF